MKTAVIPGRTVLADAPADAVLADARGKLAAYVELTKPRIAVMVLVTVATGFVLGARGASNPSTLLLTLLGTGLVAGGASAWNMYLERFRDLQMRRTAGRPLPSGRLTPSEAAVFGSALGVLGLAILVLGANLASALVALATFVLYVAVYTPLKPRTTLNTAVGAVPGALPPVIGWAAATGRLGVEALGAVPDRLPLAVPPLPGDRLALPRRLRPRRLQDAADGRSPRGDHRPPGRRLRAGAGPRRAAADGGRAGRAVVLRRALVLGLFYLAFAVRFWSEVSEPSARRLLRASFVYLPAILLLLLLNPMPA